MNSDRTGMTSKGLKQPPSHLCSPRGTSARHQSSSQSLGRQAALAIGRSSPVGWWKLYIFTCYGRFSNGRNLILYRNGVFTLIQDHSTNELRESKNLDMVPTQDSCNSLSNTHSFSSGFLYFGYCATEEALNASMVALSFTFWLYVQSIIQDLWEAALEKVSLRDV